MRLRFIYTGCYADDSMEDGFIRVDRGGDRIAMTSQTFQTLQLVDAAREVFPVMRAREDGTYLIPRSLLDKHIATEVRAGLSLVEAEPSRHCLYPPCSLEAVTERDGMPLCAEHDAVLQGWDDLLVP